MLESFKNTFNENWDCPFISFIWILYYWREPMQPEGVTPTDQTYQIKPAGKLRKISNNGKNAPTA